MEKTGLISIIIAAVVGALVKELALWFIKSAGKMAKTTQNKYRIWANNHREFLRVILEFLFAIFFIAIFCIYPPDGKMTNLSVHIIPLALAVVIAQLFFFVEALKKYIRFIRKNKARKTTNI